MATVETETGAYGYDTTRASVRTPATQGAKHDTQYAFRLIYNWERDPYRGLFGLEAGDTGFSLHIPRAALEALRDVLIAALSVEAKPQAEEAA